MKYTIVGYYEETNEPYVGHVRAESIDDALIAAPEVLIVEIFEGHVRGLLRLREALPAGQIP